MQQHRQNAIVSPRKIRSIKIYVWWQGLEYATGFNLDFLEMIPICVCACTCVCVCVCVCVYVKSIIKQYAEVCFIICLFLITKKKEKW